MRAARCIEKLLRDLQLSPTGGLICAPSEEDYAQRLQLYSPRTFPNGFRVSPRTSPLLALPSPRQAGRTGSRLLREELGKVSKQLAEQRALVATLEVEVTSVLQEKSIQESHHKAHVQQLEGEIARLQQQLGGYCGEEADAAVCEDLLRLLQEFFSHDITVAQPLYTEIVTVPEDKRRARDHILTLIYEKMHKFHEDIEQLSSERENSRLSTELQQACKTAAAEKQEMLQEVERLTSEWRDLSVAAAAEKQELVKQVQILTDELRQVATTAALEKQDMRDEVELLTHELRNLQETAHKERKNMRMEVHRLTDELRQATTAAAMEKQDLNEEVQMLTNELRLASETAAGEKQILNKEIQRLLSELHQHSTVAASVRENLSNEVNTLKEELHDLSTSAAAEKREMTDELQRLTSKIMRLFAASASEKQAMQLKLDVTTARNERLAKEAQHALMQLDTLTDKCALNGQVRTNQGLEIIQYEERLSNLGRSLTGQIFSCGLEMQDFGNFVAAITYASRIEEQSPVFNTSGSNQASKKNAICKALLSVLSNCHIE